MCEKLTMYTSLRQVVLLLLLLVWTCGTPTSCSGAATVTTAGTSISMATTNAVTTTATPAPPSSCASAGFTSCCTSGCFNGIDCFCDSICRQLNDCCEDIDSICPLVSSPAATSSTATLLGLTLPSSMVGGVVTTFFSASKTSLRPTPAMSTPNGISMSGTLTVSHVPTPTNTPNVVPPSSCEDAGFDSCCTLSFTECEGVSHTSDNCYCDRVCRQFNDCCDDIDTICRISSTTSVSTFLGLTSSNIVGVTATSPQSVSSSSKPSLRPTPSSTFKETTNTTGMLSLIPTPTNSPSVPPSSCADADFDSCCMSVDFLQCAGTSHDGITCFCDQACRNFNDCCDDIDIICPIGVTPSTTMPMSNTTTAELFSTIITSPQMSASLSATIRLGSTTLTTSTSISSNATATKTGASTSLIAPGPTITPTPAPPSTCAAAGFDSCCTSNCFPSGGNCFCDVLCRQFNDCCEDIDSICPLEITSAMSTPMAATMSILNLSATMSLTASSAVSITISTTSSYSSDAVTTIPTAIFDATTVSPTASSDATTVSPTASSDATTLSPTASSDATTLSPTASSDATTMSPTASPDATIMSPTASSDTTTVNPTASSDVSTMSLSISIETSAYGASTTLTSLIAATTPVVAPLPTPTTTTTSTDSTTPTNDCNLTPPDSVSSVSVLAIDQSTLNISWNQSPSDPLICDDDYYIITVFKYPTQVSLLALTVDGDETFVIASRNLAKWIPYTISVIAGNVIGTSTPESVLAFTEQGVPPNSPANIKVARISTTEMTVSWEPLSPVEARGFVTGYTVSYTPAFNKKRQTSSGSIVVGGHVTQVTIDDLQEGVAYFVSIKATTIAGAGVASAPVISATNPTSSPNADQGAIAGGVIGAVLVLVILTAVVILMLIIKRKRQKRTTVEEDHAYDVINPREDGTVIRNSRYQSPDFTSSTGEPVQVLGYKQLESRKASIPKEPPPPYYYVTYPTRLLATPSDYEQPESKATLQDIVFENPYELDDLPHHHTEQGPSNGTEDGVYESMM